MGLTQKSYLIIIAMVQLLLLLLGLLYIGLFLFYLIKPNYIYLHYLSNGKSKVISHYKTYGYDFAPNATTYKTDILEVFENLIDKSTKETFRLMLIYSSIGLVSTIIVTINIFAYRKRSGKYICVSSIFALLLVLVIIVMIKNYEKDIDILSKRIFNNTYKYKKKIPSCMICYKSIKPIMSNRLEPVNVLALFMHVFKCCGIQSYKDLVHNKEIPFTCCPRKNYANSYVTTENDCQLDAVYPGCYESLHNFLRYYTIFRFEKSLLYILVLLNIFYGIPSSVYGVYRCYCRPAAIIRRSGSGLSIGSKTSIRLNSPALYGKQLVNPLSSGSPLKQLQRKLSDQGKIKEAKSMKNRPVSLSPDVGTYFESPNQHKINYMGSKENPFIEATNSAIYKLPTIEQQFMDISPLNPLRNVSRDRSS